MSRETLFKGRVLDTKKQWVEGKTILTYGDGVFISSGVLKSNKGDGFKIDYSDAIQIDPKTICQFTGLLDKNGTTIFEGDKYKSPYDAVSEYIVSFENGAFVGGTPQDGVPEILSTPLGWDYDEGEDEEEIVKSYYCGRIEIVGNIHD